MKKNELKCSLSTADDQPMKSIDQLSVAALEKVLALKRQIEAICADDVSSAPKTEKAKTPKVEADAPADGKKKRKPWSKERRKKMSELQTARWAKKNGKKKSAKQ